jgi:hypothetical protein
VFRASHGGGGDRLRFPTKRGTTANRIHDGRP